MKSKINHTTHIGCLSWRLPRFLIFHMIWHIVNLSILQNNPKETYFSWKSYVNVNKKNYMYVTISYTLSQNARGLVKAVPKVLGSSAKLSNRLSIIYIYILYRKPVMRLYMWNIIMKGKLIDRCFFFCEITARCVWK